MSLIFITHHNENIRNIEKRETAGKHFVFPKYVSIHRNKVKTEPVNQAAEKGKQILTESKRYSHKSMGYAETPLNEPSCFLKKQGGVKWQRFNDHVCPPPRGLAPVPKRSEMPKKPERGKVNFIKKNIRKATKLTPPNQRPLYIDTAFGEEHDLDRAGLIPKHVTSAKFGKVPRYICCIKKQLEWEAEQCRKSEMKPEYEDVRLMSIEERENIIKGLRANYRDVENIYKKQSLLADTIPKKQRKSKLEAKLKRLEQDILLLESSPVIYICEEY